MRKPFISAAALLMGLMIANPSAVAWTSTLSPYPGPQKKKVTVPAGTRILIRTVDPIDTSKQKTGYRFTATLETNLQADNYVVAPRGTTIYGRLANAASSGKFKGSSQLTLELTDIVIQGTAYPLLTSTYEIKGKGEGGETTKKVLGGAGLGAIIGGIAGGGTGAAIGALAGAGAGTAVAASKKGEQLQIPSESLLEFRLDQPVALPVAG